MNISLQSTRISSFRILLLLLFPAAILANNDIQLELTESEQSWLKAHSVIRLASDIAWPPFEWVNEDNQFQGIATDYVELIEEKLGIQFEIDTEKPWPEVVEAVKTQQMDVFSCIAKNIQREQYVLFTRPYLSFPMVIITSTDVNYIDGIDGLKDMRVSVVKDYATHEYLAMHHPEIKLDIVNTSEEGLEEVSRGKANAFVDNIATASRIIQNKGLTNLKISGEMPVRYELSMAVRKDWPILVNILQRTLDSISNDERKNIHNKWISVRYEHGLDYDLFWRSLAVFLLITGFLYFYNRKLIHEITQRKSAEKSATIARDEANRANQAKSEFLAVMSHELRTPLTSIKGSIGLLSGGAVKNLPVKASRMLDIANDNCDRLIVLINDILDIEKLMAGKITFHNEMININELTNNAVVANQGYADQYTVALVAKTNACDSTTIFADKNRLMQVLSNLISNAVKYSPKEGSVHITTECNNEKVRIEIVDQGEGIPEEFKNSIFTYFSQADSSNTREMNGTGLGLAIAKEIIEQQGGEIGFISEAEQGTTFYFELKENRS